MDWPGNANNILGFLGWIEELPTKVVATKRVHKKDKKKGNGTERGTVTTRLSAKERRNLNRRIKTVRKILESYSDVPSLNNIKKHQRFSKNITNTVYIIALLLHKHCDKLTVSDIANIFNKHHTTITYAIQKIKKRIKNNPQLKERFKEIEQNFF